MRVTGLLFLVAYIGKLQAQPPLDCSNILCTAGFECDDKSAECIPTSCEAEIILKDLCAEGEKCVDDPKKVCVGEEPCQKFDCVFDCPIDCEDFEFCNKNSCPIGESNCQPFTCVNKCATVRCGAGTECDFLSGSGECVPVSCEAEAACEEGFECVPEEIFCITSPCPQFKCVEEPEFDGCYTDCGVEVPPFTFFENDGEKYCKKHCFCFFNDFSLCFPPNACKPDEKKEVCPPNGNGGCTTTCGTPAEGGFVDDGPNYCNVCSCTEEGFSFCTLIACPELPGEEGASCERFAETCETTCGKKVAVGVSFQDDGANSCNQCTCNGPNELSCTEIGCLKSETCGPAPTSYCTTTCGKLIADGVSYQDDGSNACNSCTCSGGVSACTKVFCTEEAKC